ncbi:MAG: membrane protein insertase YidC [Bryobacterales bacterium]|nr:membrane protein insertase YidC [Bryobacterales bacterium]
MRDPLNDDQFIHRRMILAAVLSAVVMVAYFFVAPRSEPPSSSQQPMTLEPAPVHGEPTRADSSDPALLSIEAPEGELPVEAGSEQSVSVETDSFLVEFTNRGAMVTSWRLKEYSDALGEPLDLVHRRGAERFGLPFRLVLPGGGAIDGADDALFSVTPGPRRRSAPHTLVFEFARDGLGIRKTFKFPVAGNVVWVRTEVERDGQPRLHLIAWGGGFGDTARAGNSAYSQSFRYGDGEVARVTASDAEDERIIHSGPYPYVGFEDRFFAAAAIPLAGEDVRIETSAIEIGPANAEPGDTESYVATAFGGAPRNDVRFYLGPKSREALSSVEGLGGTLRRIVDFGFFTFIAEPLLAVLRWVHGNIVANWGWSIVIVTVFINTTLFPLKYKSTKSMRKMQQLQPLVKQINSKYKGVTFRDPRKAKQNEELHALYKKHGASPMGGCLPILLQMPVVFAFYKLLTIAIEMRQAEWLWVADLSNPETLPVRVLPLAMVATQFWSQSLTPTPSASNGIDRVCGV